MYVIDVNMNSENAATTAAFFVPVWSAGNLVQIIRCFLVNEIQPVSIDAVGTGTPGKNRDS